ncbi:S-layer homology domain-containing protein [Paenibacillus sp. OV219]|uniref:S-layer homology domain-containing protein n=1 Tax=Paenibacillus sp. OV219 TaxID=1884377 RepID=UPI0008C19316|nr:S-layer homology domain-containing protein [Paenibacillus sp. OV219]SEP14146.1 S-layer homology domain-containing protein [Paenibacillus sp. OV219]
MKRRLIASISFVWLFILIFSFSGAAHADAEKTFKDVGDTYWAKDAIDSMTALGVVGGYKDNTFKPNNPVSREEFASLITRAFMLDVPAASEQTFADVSKSRWSYGAVEAAKDFLTGYYPPSGRAFFDPTGKATREDVAVALVKTLNYQPDELENSDVLDRFGDEENISPNVRTYVALAVEKKLISGYSDGTFMPDKPVTRAESAALLYRVIKGAAGDSQAQLTLNVDAPETITTSTFYISGDVTKGAKVYLNNKEIEVVQGQFRVGVPLDAEGVYTYTVTARMAGGKTQTVTKTVKYEKGAPTLEVKGVPETTDKQTITVTWTVKDENDNYPVVTVNDERTYGTSMNVELEEGDNTIEVTATNSFGKETTVTKHITFQSGGPTLNVLNVPATTDKSTITVSWTVSDKNDSYPKVYFNGDQVYGTSVTVDLEEGTNTFTIKAVNSLGKSTEVTKTVVLMSGAPVLTVNSLPATTDKDSITISWTVSDKNDSYPKVFVNNQQVYGSSANIDLSPGLNTITVKATNSSGKSSEVTRTITFNTGGPVLNVNPISVTTTQSSISVSWSVTDTNDSYPKVFINDQQMYGSSTRIDLEPGTNTLTFKATNSFGKSVEETHTIVFEPSAPRLTLGYAPETTSSSRITLTWTASDDNDSYPKVYVNDQLVYSNSMNVDLVPGLNTFKIVASNIYGKTTIITYNVTYTPQS